MKSEKEIKDFLRLLNDDNYTHPKFVNVHTERVLYKLELFFFKNVKIQESCWIEFMNKHNLEIKNNPYAKVNNN